MPAVTTPVANKGALPSRGSESGEVGAHSDHGGRCKSVCGCVGGVRRCVFVVCVCVLEGDPRKSSGLYGVNWAQW